jgi:tetratricopeptide (TPR) repeat protein
LLLEKIPFIAASLIISITSVIAQKSIGALALMDYKPLSTRLLVAFKALAVYLWKMAVPVHLIPYYPYPRSVSLLSVEYGFSVLLVAGITAAVIIVAGKKPVWLAAWGIYLVILLPTLGIVQVGVHSMGDRFTYLPSLAPFLLAGVGAARIWTWTSGRAQSSRLPKQVAAGLAIAFGCALSYATLNQIAVWNNSMNLWNYVIEKGEAFNPMAYNSRGHVYKDRGEFDKAISDYGVAIAQEPAQVEYLVSRGVAFCEKGDFERAMTDLNGAIALSPKEYLAYNNRGNVWYRKGDYARAIEDFTRAITLKPSEHLAYQNRGAVYEKTGEMDNAISDYSKVLTINPLLAGVYIDRGDLYLKKGILDLAARDYLEANNLGDRRRMPGTGERRSP